MIMMTEILRNTPIWVLGILLTLVALGVSMMKTRIVSVKRLTITPVVMIIYSFSSTLLSFGAKPLYSFAWLTGLAAVLFLGKVFMRTVGVRYLVEEDCFEVPGSIVPLLLMLAIFCLKYAIGVLSVTAPMLVADPETAALLSLIMGMLSGAFLARSLAIRSEKSPAGLPEIDFDKRARYEDQRV